MTLYPERHHPWCNYFMGPRKGCAMCEKFDLLYPAVGKSPAELMAEHFPNVVIIGEIARPAEETK